MIRLTRNPTAAALAELSPGEFSAESSGVIRLESPNWALALFRVAAPSPKNHDGVSQLGKMGFDVVSGAPGPGSALDPPEGLTARENPP
jgi:hypothetical protein